MTERRNSFFLVPVDLCFVAEQVRSFLDVSFSKTDAVSVRESWCVEWKHSRRQGGVKSVGKKLVFANGLSFRVQFSEIGIVS